MEILTRCGYRCDLCPAYKENIKTDTDREKASDGWYKFYGFRMPPAEIGCDGCLTDKDEPVLMDNGCPVRTCVLEKNLVNCAHCNDYICENLKTRMVNKEEIEKELKEPISTADYQRFIQPYESRTRLDNLKNSLIKENEISDPSEFMAGIYRVSFASNGKADFFLNRYKDCPVWPIMAKGLTEKEVIILALELKKQKHGDFSQEKNSLVENPELLGAVSISFIRCGDLLGLFPGYAIKTAYAEKPPCGSSCAGCASYKKPCQGCPAVFPLGRGRRKDGENLIEAR